MGGAGQGVTPQPPRIVEAGAKAFAVFGQMRRVGLGGTRHPVRLVEARGVAFAVFGRMLRTWPGGMPRLPAPAEAGATTFVVSGQVLRAKAGGTRQPTRPARAVFATSAAFGRMRGAGAGELGRRARLGEIGFRFRLSPSPRFLKEPHKASIGTFPAAAVQRTKFLYFDCKCKVGSLLGLKVRVEAKRLHRLASRIICSFNGIGCYFGPLEWMDGRRGR